jgi:predicted DsbA family dithiol-disulfide isomerase
MATLKIDIVSDVVCPWCLLGKARLEQALAQMPDVEAEIHWRPYMLDQSIPRGGVDRKQYMEKKFGAGPQLAEAHARLEGLGREAGIAYKFDAIKVSPNTMDAHRLIRWAAQAGPGIQDKVVDRLFRLYFEDGADIGNHTVLLKVAHECGMDNSIVSQLLATGAEEAGVIGEIEQARRIGVQGVPCFIFNQKYAVSGAQTPDVLVEAMRGALKDASVS